MWPHAPTPSLSPALAPSSHPLPVAMPRPRESLLGDGRIYLSTPTSVTHEMVDTEGCVICDARPLATNRHTAPPPHLQSPAPSIFAMPGQTPHRPPGGFPSAQGLGGSGFVGGTGFVGGGGPHGLMGASGFGVHGGQWAGQSHFGAGDGALAEEDLYRQGDGRDEEGEEDSMAELAELYRKTDANVGEGVGLEGLDMHELLDVGKPLSEFVFAALR
jgi:hypothetical protein